MVRFFYCLGGGGGDDLLLEVCLVAIFWLVVELFRWVVGLHWLFLIFCGFGFSGGNLPFLDYLELS